MIKRYIYCLILMFVCSLAFSQVLPQPKGDMMYTEFTSEKKLRYLKKPIVSTGKIVMYSKQRLLYEQDSPASFTVVKDGQSITYKRPNVAPMKFNAADIVASDNSDMQIMSFFVDDESVADNYNVQTQSFDGVQHYTITPKKIGKIKLITAVGQDDKLSSLIIFFTDESTIKNIFKNTVTGKMPTYEIK